jgi:hypothetical protein
VIGGLLCSKLADILVCWRALLYTLLIMAAGDVLFVVHPTIGFVAVSFFDDVLGPVVECGKGLVSPRYISNALLRCVNRIYRFFGWGSLPFGAFASGAIVVWAEPELGRGLASKMPFSFQLLGRLQFFYVILGLKLS